MPKQSILTFIKKLNRLIFTTHELANISGKSVSNASQSLNYLEEQDLIVKLYRGIWALKDSGYLSPYMVVPFLLPRHRVYVSFVSALHLYGIIEQIPQVVTLASTTHTKIIKASIATYSIHKIAPAFFKGFDWYKGKGGFLIAEPEKALVDCLYLAARKKKSFRFFPELYFPDSFSFKKAKAWAKSINDGKVMSFVLTKLNQVSSDPRYL